MFNLTVNSTHVANSLNNTYVYNFKSGGFIVPEDAQMMITSFTIPYSFYNISSRYNNNSLRIYWPSSTVNSITLTNGGSGYTSVPTVGFTGSSTTTATATAVLAPTTIASFSVSAGGTGYTRVPTVTITDGGGSGATATANLTPTTIASYTISAGGSGYTTAPTVAITGGGGSGATGTATISGGAVTGITVNAAGTNFTGTPTITFSGGGGTGASAIANFTATSVATLTLTAAGTNFTGTPTITFSTGFGSGAVATAVFTPTTVASITLAGGGTGYSAAPTITFTGGSGSNAAATTNLYVPFTCTIPDGFYTVNTLNLFLQKFMMDNRIHSVDSSGNNIFYLSMAPNATVYGNQIILKAIPTTLASGVTSPTGTNPSFPGLPTGTAKTPYIEILNNQFTRFLGFTAGNYGLSATTDQSFVSNITPKGSTVNNLILKCSIVNNNTTNFSDIIDVFSIGAATGGAVFGANLNYTNDIEKWVRITPGTYNSIIITIVDENMQDIAILDNNLLINFLIKTP